MSYNPGQNHPISYAIAIALVVHGFVLFFVAFASTSSATNPSQMEVTISHSNSEEKPDEADFLAQNNQLGSGDSEEQKELTTKYEALFADSKINDVQPIVIPEHQQSERAVVDPRIITTIGEAQRSIMVIEPPLDADEFEQEGDVPERNLTELSREIASLEARLADKQQQLTKNPRVLILTSTSSIAAENARYVHQWRDRVESVGNLHYPKEARERELYGDVRLLVKLNARGFVEETTIMSSSGSEVLDRAAIESIRLASPFEPFPRTMAEKYDRIDVIRTWQFRKDRLSAKSG